jgi:3D (Asp-Asp-Asp) domain-containing protein
VRPIANLFALLVALGLVAISVFSQQPSSKPAAHHTSGSFRATAYAQSGITASGEWTHRHVVAADPDILPLGTRIRIRHAGKYSGEYVVADTGAAIQGRRLDIYMPNEAACRKFGTRLVKVQVLQWGDGTAAAAKQADAQVKHDVDKELQKQAVGSAATEEDWSRSKKPTGRTSQ